MIDLVMLKDFLVLCRIKSFSRAAQECHVSVSGLSRRIQTLEQWLGAPVFERHKHALELTEAGKARPPALRGPPSRVWQTAQSPRAARRSPRAICSALKGPGVPSSGPMAGCQA